MPTKTDQRPRIRPATQDLLPAGAALSVSVVACAGAALGLLGWPPALLLSALAWAAAAVALALRVRARERRLGQERLRTKALGDLQAQHGIAEQLGGFGTWVIERGGSRFAWSPGTFRLFGIPAEGGEPSLRSFAAAIHEDDRQRWIDVHRRAMHRGGEARIEYRFQRAPGETIWVRSIARAQHDGRGRVDRLGGVAQDITGIRAMQQQLAASEAKFRDLTQMSSDWVWETDGHHCWSYFSDSVDAVLGRWVRDLQGRYPWDLPEGRIAFEPPDWKALQGLMDAHAPFEDFEYAVIDPEGVAHFVSVSGRAMFDRSGAFAGYRGVGKAITREKQQRMLLRIESEIASIMREQADPERVSTSVILTLCGVLGWVGGANLVLIPGRKAFAAHERWGHPGVVRMLAELPAELPLLHGSAEAQAWNEGKPLWIEDLEAHPQLAHRYQTTRLGVRAAFLAPIVDEDRKVLSVLLFLSPASYRGKPFLFQVAETVSRNLSLFLQRIEAERRLTHQSRHDALTDLPNRIFLTQKLESRLARSEAAAVLYIDLDRYKLINDTLGHSVGDQVLIEVAKRLRAAIRPQDVAGRIGGDEFILLLTGLSDREEIERIARRVLASIEKPFVLKNRAYFLSASIGVAIAPDDGTDAALLIKRADAAMYRVKSEGRNDVRFCTGEVSDERTDQLQLAAELPLALERGDLDLYYQPILDVAHRHVVGFEALLRWRHPVRGLLLPESFLAVVEQNNLIRELGLWSLRRALDDRVALGLDRHEDAAVSVNVSARHFAEGDFLATVNGLLAERSFPARLLRLELTESAFLEHPERAAALIAELRRIGVQVIIDNFGTGYAALSYLKDLPVDGLKIDRAFVHGLPADRGNAAIVEAITTLAARLGVQAMAEGVETAAELRALRQLDCQQVQGTLISEPMSLAQLQDFMDALPEIRRMHLVQ